MISIIELPDSDNDGWCDTIDPCPNDPNCPVNHDPNPCEGVRCPNDGYIGNPYCKNGDLYQRYRDYYCENGECKYTETEKKIKDCEGGCENGGCIVDPPPTTPPPKDSDGDGVPDDQDKCPGYDDKKDGDKDGVPDGCDECPISYGNGKNGCTCNRAQAERYLNAALDLQKRIEARGKGNTIIGSLGGGATILGAATISSGGLVLAGFGVFCAVWCVMDEFFGGQKDWRDMYDELMDKRDNYLRGCPENVNK